MRSYSIALLFHAVSIDHDDYMQLETFRRALPFASIHLYCDQLDEAMRTALQKLDVTLRPGPCDNRFRLLRRMFTEIDADVFAFIGSIHYQASHAAAMIHQLVEGRYDMLTAMEQQPSQAPEALRYQRLCSKLYGDAPQAPLSDFRVFSRRFVKSFAAFERGFPIELEWTIHALELDIPVEEYPVDTAVQPPSPAISPRQSLTRFILNLQARPLKWFGLATALNAIAMLAYKLLFCFSYMGYELFLDMTQSAIGAGIFGIMAFASALSGLSLHSISHQRRELKRLHFQQHSTL